ncbi:hypothetical protein [Zobellia laminariae]|uniref:hypothetical protein n=1 Tax=Zobellia laminariae TaxID=248906 RepID=UPI0026F4534D|nr:hypothetical protein [Zobellia laminariae]WKX75894.1 hypothetical protein Q5W13_20230 [Zobellia laminariae]
MHPTIEYQKTGLLNSVYNLNDDVKFSIDYGDDEHIWMFKPILKPLKDLNEDILCISWIEHIQDKGLSAELPYEVWTVLFENHFDVFELIDKKIAIDENDL